MTSSLRDSEPLSAHLDEASTRPETGVLALLAVSLGLLLPIAFSSSVYASFWTPKAAVSLLLVGVGLPLLVALASAGQWAARAVLVFLALALVSTLLSDRPALSFFGLYNSGVGLLFYAAVAGAWAIGRFLGDRARSRLLWAVLAAVGVNAVVAIAQTLVDLSEYQLGRPLDRADGLLGNPVHLGALTAAAIVAAGHRWHRERDWRTVPLLSLFATALQLSGSRFALGAAVVGLALVALRQRLLRVVIAALAVLAGFGAGAFIAGAADVPSGTARVTTEATAGVGPRAEIWLAGAKAFAERPVLGWGPGRFREATGSRRTLRLALAEGPEAQFLDAHNLVVEVGVTTGALGLAAAVAWAVAAMLRARGPLAVFAAVGLALTLVQPLNVSTVPVAVLCLGAAGKQATKVYQGRRRRALSVSMSVGAVVTLAAAFLLLFGDFTRLQAEFDFDLDDAEAVDRVSPPWPETAELIGKVHLFRAVLRAPDDRELVRQAIEWRRRAVERDPSDAESWSDLGELALTVPDLGLAQEAFEGALEANPQSSRAFLGLGEVAVARRHYDVAVDRYTQALRRTNIESNREFLRRRIARASAAAAES